MSQYSGPSGPPPTNASVGSGSQPILPNHPVDLGEMMSASFRAYKSRFGGYLLITLMPFLASLVIFGVAGLAAVAVGVGAFGSFATGRRTPDFGDVFGPVALIMLITLVASAATGFFSLKAEGMKARLTEATIEHSDSGGMGPKPTFGDAWDGTRGFVLRILPSYLLLLAVSFVAILLYAGIGVAMMVPAIRSADSPDRMFGSMVGFVGITLLFEVLYMVAYVIIGTRLYPLIPVIVSERVGGLDALKRAWQLTKGYGLRTFGYSLVSSLIPVGILYAFAFVGVGIGSGTLTASLSTLSEDPGALSPATVIGSLLLMYLPAVVGAVLVMPFVGIFQAIYTLDLRRRERLGLRPGQRFAPNGFAPNGYPQQPPNGPQPYGQQPPYPPQQPPNPAQQQPNPGQPAQPNPWQSGPGQPGPGQPGPGQAGPGQAGPWQSEPGQANPWQSEPGQRPGQDGPQFPRYGPPSSDA